MVFQNIWFSLIGFILATYFFLEGFDYGVGILLPILGRDDTRRRVIINTIGPHWDGNEVWLILLGGAMFAAFPDWYATFFSGFYLPLFLLLLSLILRGVSFEYRGKQESRRWRTVFDWMIFTGSIVPSFLWGVVISNFIRGVPIDANMHYIGGFWNLFNGYAILGGLVTLLFFALHGAIFLNLKTEGALSDLAHGAVLNLWLPAFIAFGGYTILSFSSTDFMGNPANLALALSILFVLLFVGWFSRARKMGFSFILGGVVLLLFATFVFLGLYPRLMISSLNPAWSLTVSNSASAPYTLQVMSGVAVIFIPLILGYQVWAYWTFRRRVKEEPESLEY
jgi:cytochrome d ubiquinol oxidase subunit II